MHISLEGKIGIALALAFGFGSGAVMVFPLQMWIGWTIMGVSLLGGVFLAIHHFGPAWQRYSSKQLFGQRERKLALVGMAICAAGFLLFAVSYFWVDAPKSLAWLLLPVAAAVLLLSRAAPGVDHSLSHLSRIAVGSTETLNELYIELAFIAVNLTGDSLNLSGFSGSIKVGPESDSSNTLSNLKLPVLRGDEPVTFAPYSEFMVIVLQYLRPEQAKLVSDLYADNKSVVLDLKELNVNLSNGRRVERVPIWDKISLRRAPSNIPWVGRVIEARAEVVLAPVRIGH